MRRFARSSASGPTPRRASSVSAVRPSAAPASSMPAPGSSRVAYGTISSGSTTADTASMWDSSSTPSEREPWSLGRWASPSPCGTWVDEPAGRWSHGGMAAPAAPLIDDDALDDLEREVLGRVRGRVLEIGAGAGENFGAWHPDVSWTGLEPDAKRRTELATRAREWRHEAPPLDAVAEAIPLPDASVDVVVGTYVLCS